MVRLREHDHDRRELTRLYTMKQLALRVGFANDRALRHAVRRWNAPKSERR
jgi:hypothetical protein